jgi:hypothetical protein
MPRQGSRSSDVVESSAFPGHRLATFAAGETKRSGCVPSLLDSFLHFEWSGHTGPGNLGNAPKVPPATADMRPDPSGKPAFRPLAMHW